jgi:hypothetical protein
VIRGSEVGVVASEDALAQGLGVNALRDAGQNARVERAGTLGLVGEARESPARLGLAPNPGVVSNLKVDGKQAGESNGVM